MSLLSAVIQEANKTNTEEISRARSDLLPKIIDLAERLQVFSWGLQNYYIDVYLTSDSSRSLEQMNYKNRKYRATADLDELQQEIETFRKKFGKSDVETNNACKKLDAVVSSFNDSCTVVDGTYVLQAAARDLKSLKYVDAVVKLKDLHERLDKVEFQGNLATALRGFRAISETQLAVSQGQVSVEFANLFKWNFKKDIHTLIYSLSVQQSDPILLENVLRALYIADQMIIDIQPFSHFFVTIIVPNVIKHNCEIFTEDDLGALVFNIKINLKDGGNPSIPTIFNNLMAVFEFLETTMGAKFGGDKTFFESFGDCNREEFFRKIINDCIKRNLPSCENSYQAYKEIASELETFNKFLVNLKYVEAYKSPLQKYVDHTDLLMYDTKCKKMLAEVRGLMKAHLSQSTVTVGSVLDDHQLSIFDFAHKGLNQDPNTPLFFPKCVVSQNVTKIDTIIKMYLEESAKLPMEYANQLIPYIKDIAEMYQGIVMQINGAQLKSHALEIALFFNNCHYLAHSLVGPPWKNILPKPIADQLNTTLMSCIYDLRIFGLERLSLFLSRNKEAVSQKLAGSLSLWSLRTFETFNAEVNHALKLLKDMKDTWQDVLPSRMYEQAVCAVIEAITETMLKRVLLHVDNITEDVVSLLASRFQYTIDEIHVMFPEFINLPTKVKDWEKFILIPKLFTAQLLEIANMWQNDHNLSRQFTCDEVRLIIKIRFPNNDYRLKILKGIQ